MGFQDQIVQGDQAIGSTYELPGLVRKLGVMVADGIQLIPDRSDGVFVGHSMGDGTNPVFRM